MMSEYTPSLDEARDRYADARAGIGEWTRFDDSVRRAVEDAYAEFDRMIAKVRAEALREASDAFEGGAINVKVFGDGPEVVYWRTANETRGNIVSSLRARADRIERGESS